MKTFQKILLTICFMGCALHSVAGKQDDMELTFAVDVIRHAHRAPMTHLPQISNVWTKDQLGHLLEVGKAKSVLLGQKLRHYYVDKTHLLPANFQPNLMQVISTDTLRTADTARALLQGFYPGEFERIKVSVVPEAEDSLMMNKRKPECKKEMKAFFQASNERFLTSPETIYKQGRAELAIVNKIFGTKFSSASDLIDLGDLLSVSKTSNKPLVQKLGQANIDRIILIRQELMQNLYNDNPRVSCIYSQNFVTHIAKLFEEHALGQKEPRYILYTSHDVNILAAAFLLGTPTKMRATPYLADLRFELFKNSKTGETFVRTSLNGKALRVCKSGTTCPTAEFVRTIRESVESKCPVS